jgi:hypothetical protein
VKVLAHTEALPQAIALSLMALADTENVDDH